MFSLLSPLLLASYVHHLLAHSSNNRVRALSANSSFSFRTFWSFEPEPPERQEKEISNVSFSRHASHVIWSNGTTIRSDETNLIVIQYRGTTSNI